MQIGMLAVMALAELLRPEALELLAAAAIASTVACFIVNLKYLSSSRLILSPVTSDVKKFGL